MSVEAATETGEFQPSPAPTELTEPFWTGGLSGELRLQRCADCGHVRYPVSTICPRCLSPEATWSAMSGRGIVQSYIVFERAYHEAWASQVPYVVALIELAEGPVLISNVVGVEPSAVRVGQPVSVVFERRSATAALPQFAPRTDATAAVEGGTER